MEDTSTAIPTVESLDLRREEAGHPRGYLDFLGPFIEQARGGKRE